MKWIKWRRTLTQEGGIYYCVWVYVCVCVCGCGRGRGSGFELNEWEGFEEMRKGEASLRRVNSILWRHKKNYIILEKM